MKTGRKVAVMTTLNETGLTRTQRHWSFAAVLVGAFLAGVSRPAEGLAEGTGLSVEYGCLTTHADAGCSRIRVYVRNDGAAPVFVEKLELGQREVTVDCGVDAKVGSSHNAQGEQEVRDRSYIAQRTDGNIQWVRVLPNPIPAGAVSEIAVSLWDVVSEMPIRMVTREGQALEWLAREEKASLRLSQITFDPANPNITPD